MGEEKWEVIATSASPIWWNGNYYITSNYTPVSIEGTGNTVSDDGFHSPDDTVGQSDLAYGEYEFTFDFPYPYSDVPFTLDLRDAEWSTQYPYPHDIYIKCNANNGMLKKKLGAGGTYTTLTESSIWAIYGYSNPFNQTAFQPTKPENFMCYNANEIGEHPLFVWSASVGCENTTIYYKIFRSEKSSSFACVDDDFTEQGWIDYKVCIGPKKQGSSFAYYVKAYTGQSPESESSNFASIWGDQIISKSIGTLLEQNLHYSNSQSNPKATGSYLSFYPNPFNSFTTIRYDIPTDGNVQLAVYNIFGQQVTRCVDQSQVAGTYQLDLIGTNLPGGFYLVQLQFNNQYLTKKILLLK